MKNIAHISDAEWEVMNLVWKQQPVTSAQVVEELSQKHDWASRTIRTLVDRLVKKGVLEAKMDGKRHLYTAKVTMEACVKKESRSFIDRVFGGEPASMLVHLVKESKLSAKEIRELKDILNAKEK
jgi:BlaI family penicillinase repressor